MTREQHELDLQRIKEFCLFDDAFMTKCFEDNLEGTTLLLQILLGKEDLQVTNVKTQSVIQNLQGRSVRLDIKATDAEKRVYDIEVQRIDHGANRKRARHNSAMLDAAALQAGESVELLPESYVIFITENDILKKNRSIYPVERCIITEEEPILFEDGAHILYVNGARKDNTPIGRLMHDFSCTNPDEMYYEILAKRARYFKEKKEGIEEMSGIQEVIRNEGRQEGRREGKIEERLETAQRMLRDGELTMEKIALYTGLTLEKVKELAEPITA